LRKYSAILLVLLGAVIIVAGAVGTLKETNVLSVNLDVFGPVLFVVVGVWIVGCALEFRTWHFNDT